MFRQGSRSIGICAAAVGLLLLPHLTTGDKYRGWRPRLGWPRVVSGDEPHYLILIHSLVNDGDLDLRNNYAAVHAGGGDAGRFWGKLRTLDHHSRLRLAHGGRADWMFLYLGGPWQRDAEGVVSSPLRSGAPQPDPATDERPSHTPAIAFLLYPLLWPFRGTDMIESAVVLISGLAVVGAFLAYRQLLRAFSNQELSLDLCAIVAFLGTPTWFYGRALFLESFLTLFVVAAYALSLRRRQSVVPALLLGAAMQLKPYFLLVALPLVGEAIWRREWLRAARFSVTLGFAAGLLLCTNAWLNGSPWTPPQPFRWGDPVQGGAGLLFSPRIGVLALTPIALIALLLWPRFLRQQGAPAVVILAGVLALFVPMACFNEWHGGYCFGARLIVPIVPLLLVPLVTLAELPARVRPWFVGAAVPLAAAAVFFNATGAIYYGRSWGKHPLITFLEVFPLLG